MQIMSSVVAKLEKVNVRHSFRFVGPFVNLFCVMGKDEIDLESVDCVG